MQCHSLLSGHYDCNYLRFSIVGNVNIFTRAHKVCLVLSPHCYVIVIVIVIVFVIVILFVFVSLVAPVPEKILPLSSFTYFHEDHNTIYRNHSLVPKLSVAAKILVD